MDVGGRDEGRQGWGYDLLSYMARMAQPSFPILFVTASRVGDAVLSSGLLKRLVDEAPQARFTIVAAPLTAPLFHDAPRLERLIALEKQTRGLHWVKLWRQVRKRRWGLVLDMRGSGLARLLRTRRMAVASPPPPGRGARAKGVAGAGGVGGAAPPGEGGRERVSVGEAYLRVGEVCVEVDEVGHV